MYLSTRKYLKVKDFYWVAKFKPIYNSELIYGHRFSRKKPPLMPNPRMDWFRPTFIDLFNLNNKMFKDLKKNER